MDAINKQDVAEAFAGKLWTYTPAIHGDQQGLGIAVANERGYSPVAHNMTRELVTGRYDEAGRLADALNAERGQTKRESLEIVASSMAQAPREARIAEPADDMDFSEGDVQAVIDHAAAK